MITKTAVQRLLDETSREIEEIRGKKNTLTATWIMLTARAEALRDVLAIPASPHEQPGVPEKPYTLREQITDELSARGMTAERGGRGLTAAELYRFVSQGGQPIAREAFQQALRLMSDDGLIAPGGIREDVPARPQTLWVLTP